MVSTLFSTNIIAAREVNDDISPFALVIVFRGKIDALHSLVLFPVTCGSPPLPSRLGPSIRSSCATARHNCRRACG
ncbi:MAG: hypothetical protein VW931_08510 [Alphaproteobacteria bacterium]